MDIFSGLLAFAGEISIRHVLALNLMGYIIKCFLTHRGWDIWTDIIPVFLAAGGITLAYMDIATVEDNPFIVGLANAGMAWLLHQTIKKTKVARAYVKGKTDGRFGNKQN